MKKFKHFFREAVVTPQVGQTWRYMGDKPLEYNGAININPNDLVKIRRLPDKDRDLPHYSVEKELSEEELQIQSQGVDTESEKCGFPYRNVPGFRSCDIAILVVDYNDPGNRHSAKKGSLGWLGLRSGGGVSTNAIDMQAIKQATQLAERRPIASTHGPWRTFQVLPFHVIESDRFIEVPPICMNVVSKEKVNPDIIHKANKQMDDYFQRLERNRRVYGFGVYKNVFDEFFDYVK